MTSFPPKAIAFVGMGNGELVMGNFGELWNIPLGGEVRSVGESLDNKKQEGYFLRERFKICKVR